MTAFLFDLDGTLADTLPIIITSSRLALQELGHPEITDAQIISLIGVPLFETGEILLGEGKGDLYRSTYHSHFLTLDQSGLRAFPGIAELLRALEQAGAKLACVTSKRLGPAERTLAQLRLRAYFQALVTAESCENHKPDPAPALLALSLLGAEQERGVFVGDSVFDIGCGKNAGLTCCGVTWGAETADGLREAGADYVVDTVAELQEVLLGLV